MFTNDCISTDLFVTNIKFAYDTTNIQLIYDSDNSACKRVVDQVAQNQTSPAEDVLPASGEEA